MNPKSEKTASQTECVPFDANCMDIDCKAAVQEVGARMREAVGKGLQKRGAVVAVSGGIDSSVCAMLAARALGPERVFGLLLPERDSSPESTRKGRAVCEAAGIAYEVEDIAPALEALGCYRRRDEAIRSIFPEFGDDYRSKIAVADQLLDRDRMNYFKLIIESPDGVRQEKRMPLGAYLQVVASTNMKQRTRKLLEYYHAEQRNYVVIGTPNRLEYDQGFFVRGGDGLADVKPIAHFYKTQVYALARHLGVPEDVCNTPPTTDTYSLPQTQEEFYFALPYHQMDRLLCAYTNGVSEEDAGAVLDLTPEQVQRAYRDIEAKRRTAERLDQPAILIEAVDRHAGEAAR